MQYNFREIEKKWQKKWEQYEVFKASDDTNKPKYYALVEFPYPSGQGLHVGHPRPYTALDIIARKRRMQGYNVLFPMGWDAFGLPTENYAIEHHIHPEIITKQNIARFKGQLQSLGLSFDWTREINTSNEKYYHWTQWIFLQLFKKGLAYKKEMNVNWCTSCRCVLANEEVVNGVCERCGNEVIHKKKSQWMLKITDYAKKLIDGLEEVDYLAAVKTQQKNWIGRSDGVQLYFPTTTGDQILIYTTRPDTLFGVTYLVLAPEHPFIEKIKSQIQNMNEVEAYIKNAAKKSDLERSQLNKEKTGVQAEGIFAVHPITKKEIPIFISDYVLMDYGTGAVMAVPAHDARDYDFAKKYDLPMMEVISGGNIQKEAYTSYENGTLIHSEFLNGMNVKQAIQKMTQWLEERHIGTRTTNYKLRDWVFARQRYWGEPIPIIYCERCGTLPVPEEELPLKLPQIDSFTPNKDGESPLAKIDDFVNTTCPICHGPAKRETDTMPQWAGSSWYYLRFCDPKNDHALASKEKLDYWLPVDWYNGGMEHTTLHLLYSRFWHKFLYDIGVVSCKEPYKKRTSHGMILGENGEKMSKSRGNVVNPDDVIKQFGADTLRLYEMFIGDFEKAAPWSTSSIKGCARFLERVWHLQEILKDGTVRPSLEGNFHRTIKKVSNDIEAMKFNTAISSLMTLLNQISSIGSITKEELKIFITLLSPFAPHITEEIYENLHFEGLLCIQPWPSYDEAKCKVQEIEMVIQINGKLKDKIYVKADEDKEKIIMLAKNSQKTSAILKNKTILKEIFIPNKLINFVIGK